MEKLMDTILQLLIVIAILDNDSHVFPQCHKEMLGLHHKVDHKWL